MPDSCAPGSTTPPSSSSTSSKCVCDVNVQSASAALRFGHVYQLVCFKHGIITPQASNWLPTLPGRLYPSGVAGVSRSGKSYLENRKAKQRLLEYLAHHNGDVGAAAAAAGVAALPADPSRLGQFVESPAPVPETRGIQALALPRPSKDGVGVDTELILDAEGQELGATVDHEAILGILSRVVTHITFVEDAKFTHAAVRALGKLVASQLIVAGKVGRAGGNTAAAGTSSSAGAAGSYGSVSWPYLHLLVNKRTLDAPANNAAYIHDQLRNDPNDTNNNADRDTVRRTWADRGRLTFSTLPIDQSALGAAWWKKLPAEAQQLASEEFVTALREWCDESYKHTAPFTWRYAAAVDGGGAAADQQAAVVSGAQYAQFIDTLIRAYFTARTEGSGGGGGGGGVDPAGAVETFVQVAANAAVYAAAAHYTAQMAVSPHLLATGNNEVDGARGTADEVQAASILPALHARHAALAALCHQHYDSAVVAYKGLGRGVDAVLATAKASLTTKLANRLTTLDAHWLQQRSFNAALTTQEHDTQDDPPYNVVHHVHKRQVYFHTDHHYFWVTYVNRRNRTRTKSVRYNADVVYSPWTVVGDPWRVQMGGVWPGVAP